MRSGLSAVCALLCGAWLIAGCSGGGNGDGGTTSGGTSATATNGGTTTTGGTSATSSGGTSGGGVTLGTTCHPTDSPDTICLPAGYRCDANSSTCQLPGEFFQCLSDVGCIPGLTCTPGFTDGHGGTVSLCVQLCQQTLDCTNSRTVCAALSATTKACLDNTCGPGTTNGDGAYLACQSVQPDDGTCLPLGSLLLCQQSGGAAPNAHCSNNRLDGGTDLLCPFASVCVGFGGTKNACVPACAVGTPTFPDGGPGCADNAACVALGTTFGACLQHCTAVADCPATTWSCTGIQGVSGIFCIPPS